MKMKTVVTLKDGTVYEDKNFDKEWVAKLVEELGKLLDTDSIESIFVTKSIFTKEIKEKYFDAFEEAIESIRVFFSEESCENTTKEAESFFGAEMLKLKLAEEEKGRAKDREWYRDKIIKLKNALEEKEKTSPANEEELAGLKSKLEEATKENERLFKLAKEVLENNKKLAKENGLLKEENVCLFEEKQAIMHSKLYVDNMSLRNRVEELKKEIEAKDFSITGLMDIIERIDETKDKEVSTIRMGHMDEISKLKEEIEKDNKDLLEQRNTIDRMSRETAHDNSLITIIEEQANELDRLTSKIGELMDENAGKDSKIKALQLFLKNTNEVVSTMGIEIARLNQVIKRLIDNYKENNSIFEKNYNALLLEINSLKKRTLWQRIRNKH